MSEAWPLGAPDEDNAPLPTPWNADVDIGDRNVESALLSLQYTQPELALRVCRKVFCNAEAKDDKQAALHALYLACSHLSNRGQYALAGRLFEAVQDRVKGLGRSQLSTRIELFHAARLRERGELAQAVFIHQNALSASLALGDNRLIFFALSRLAESAIDLGDAELTLALLEQQENLLPSDDVLAVNFRGDRANKIAFAWMQIAHAKRSAKDEAAARAALFKARNSALEACTGAKTDRDTLHWLETLVQIYLQLGDADEARAQVARFSARLSVTPPHDSVLWCLLQIASTRIDLHEGAASRRTLETLEAIARLQGEGSEIDLYVDTVQRVLLTAHERLSQYEQALICHKRFTNWQAQRSTTELRQRLKILRQSVLAMRAEAVEFITHDLRTPLAAAQTWLQSLLVAQLQPAARPPLCEADVKLRVAMTLSDHYLGLLRAELLPRTDLQVLDIGALVDDVCENAPSLKRLGLRLTRDIDIGTPVLGNATLLTKALTALLADACDRAPVGTPVKLRLAHNAVAGNALLSISHQGPGPAEATHTRLCQQFIDGQVFSAGELRLALVAKVARLHRARLRFENLPGQGSRLWFSMKLAGVTRVATEPA